MKHVYPEIEKKTGFVDYDNNGLLRDKVFFIAFKSYVRIEDSKGTFEIIVRHDEEIPVKKIDTFNIKDVYNLTNSVIRATDKFHKKVYFAKHFYKKVEDQTGMPIYQKDLGDVSEKERLLKTYSYLRNEM